MKVLQINTIANSGSVGRIAENIGLLLLQRDHQSYIAAAKFKGKTSSVPVPVGSSVDFWLHALRTRLFDAHGFGSARATAKLIKEIKRIRPDLIHLHNIHGYYLHVGLLFNFLKASEVPVVWTLHDCWPFTGHCSHFERVNCYRWQTQCYQCPNKHGYPASYLLDRSALNFLRKKSLFTSLKKIQIITPSAWLASHVKNSFLKSYPLKTIYNGIDLQVFNPVPSMESELRVSGEQKIILGVANVWNRFKGLDDFLQLRELLPGSFTIILIGLTEKQRKKMPSGITGITRTENIQQLASYYAQADVYVNLTYSDNFPTTNLEALASGTPVITYDTGGCGESVAPGCGMVVPKGDLSGVVKAIEFIVEQGKLYYAARCREHAVKHFNKDDRYNDYLELYARILDGKFLSGT